MEQLIKKNKPWWKWWSTKAEKNELLYKKGYSWAAGKLLQTLDIEEVQNWVDCSKHFDDYNNFDIGTEKAIHDFKNLRS